MTTFVLDNSVAMRWLLESDMPADQKYAIATLESLQNATALVPTLWHLDAANVLLGARNKGRLSVADVERFVSQLHVLPIQADALTSQQAFGSTLSLAHAYQLSSYDAAYLELALREGIPLATLDKDLLKAARKARVAIYLK
ncbi:MAG: type II toxin-antitoxin system VapC family toxin [Gammaproteobacteria bacterium]|nr:type II toxin-antitoxin system VapC family toxin [Gammaproteobacteria bacterium]MDP2347531.1 type II toxin-antitoxin system VapC family toxin [Gammaproteobacteria bacterium]